MTRRHLLVSGRVQGVFFRDSLQREAESQGVAGWVRNTDEGKVEAAVEGDDDAVEAVVRWCREGPERADVDDVQVSEQDPEGFDGFEVR